MSDAKDKLPVVAWMHFAKDGNTRAWSANISDQTLAHITEAIGHPPTPVCNHAAATSLIAELQRELAEARRDAERYRWLRDPGNQEAPGMVAYYSPDGLDSAIDAARGEKKE